MEVHGPEELRGSLTPISLALVILMTIGACKTPTGYEDNGPPHTEVSAAVPQDF